MPTPYPVHSTPVALARSMPASQISAASASSPA